MPSVSRTPVASKLKSKKAVRRGKGRPPANGSAVGREALISKTCDLLTQFPASKVTPSAVARAMHVDRTLIRYYFKDREVLLLAAVEQLTTTHFLALVEEESVLEDNSPAGRLRARIAALLDLEIKFPFFSRLITDELAQMKSQAARKLLARLTSRGLAGYTAILESGVESGAFRRANPAWVFLTIVGLCQYFATSATVISQALGGGLGRTAIHQQYRDFICDLMLRYLQPDTSVTGTRNSPAH
jgi:AcrR family transcriptional regulator